MNTAHFVQRPPGGRTGPRAQRRADGSASPEVSPLLVLDTAATIA